VMVVPVSALPERLMPAVFSEPLIRLSPATGLRVGAAGGVVSTVVEKELDASEPLPALSMTFAEKE